MARTRDMNSKIRRRRIVAAVIFLIVVGVVVGVAVAATQHHKTPVPPPPPPPPKPFRIVFPEGFTRVQMGVRVHDVAKIADREHRGRVRLNELAYLAATKSARVPCFGRAKQSNLEGFLFPATYDFVAATTSKDLALDQIQAFCRTFRKVDLSYARSKNLTPYDVLKIASMIEEEAAVPADRPRIAAVIYNRLRNRMPLGIDATLRYGLHIPPTQSITEAELASSNPYNTRKLYGLPPTPIGNPGLASLQAAAHPAKVGYLYYVRIPGTNRHVFFESGSAYDQYLATHHYGPHP
ncbi:MAG TPA: endolytic transglycosylase MltG [Gaiellaceae bacterium]|nr:endolytic transglycosylase MltG [Gaiellaceae bacterium]